MYICRLLKFKYQGQRLRKHQPSRGEREDRVDKINYEFMIKTRFLVYEYLIVSRETVI